MLKPPATIKSRRSVFAGDRKALCKTFFISSELQWKHKNRWWRAKGVFPYLFLFLFPHIVWQRTSRCFRKFSLEGLILLYNLLLYIHRETQEKPQSSPQMHRRQTVWFLLFTNEVKWMTTLEFCMRILETQYVSMALTSRILAKEDC